MNYSIELSDNFKKEAKRLIKKYRSLKDEISELGSELETNPTKGTALGDDIYKIRLSIKSKGKGKRGGARIISLVQVIELRVVLLSIYSKGDKDDISDQEIKDLIRDV